MTSDLDIYRSANLLIKQHGEDAPIHAAMRADAMLEKGDLGGYAVWKRVLRAVSFIGGKKATLPRVLGEKGVILTAEAQARLDDDARRLGGRFPHPGIGG